jgi:hypothetical protein
VQHAATDDSQHLNISDGVFYPLWHNVLSIYVPHQFISEILLSLKSTITSSGSSITSNFSAKAVEPK